ncbi:MAG TPA: hypothetical protein VN704_05780 [Verrucomicrobiae bacterium]|nr:hypothetical protein [Verrucomicrobiae bacterium]
MPIIPYEIYDSAHIENITKMVFELVYTSYDLKEFARELNYVDVNGNVKQSFNWDEQRRKDIQGKIDALYFHLYGIDREEVEYILDTFEILKNDEIETYKEYLTKRNILKHYDNYPHL